MTNQQVMTPEQRFAQLPQQVQQGYHQLVNFAQTLPDYGTHVFKNSKNGVYLQVFAKSGKATNLRAILDFVEQNFPAKNRHLSSSIDKIGITLKQG